MKELKTSGDEDNPIIYGEVLFDIFPDGTAVMGGAPFNVAWNLQGLGINPLFISRVGKDKRAEQILKSMEAWGMTTKGIQIDDNRPTGIVQVTLDKGQPEFTLVPEQAYDFLDGEKALSVCNEEDFSLLYRGTVVARRQESRKVVEDFTNHMNLPIFLDINLRSPWWEQESIIKTLRQAQWAKLNIDEMAAVLNKKERERGTLEDIASEARATFGLELLIVTLGGEGALLVTESGEVIKRKPEKKEQIQDTVGAGDAFSSVMILGLCRKWPLKTTFERAIQFASDVCLLQGATILEKEFYHNHLRQWEEV